MRTIIRVAALVTLTASLAACVTPPGPSKSLTSIDAVYDAIPGRQTEYAKPAKQISDYTVPYTAGIVAATLTAAAAVAFSHGAAATHIIAGSALFGSGLALSFQSSIRNGQASALRTGSNQLSCLASMLDVYQVHGNAMQTELGDLRTNTDKLQDDLDAMTLLAGSLPAPNATDGAKLIADASQTLTSAHTEINAYPRLTAVTVSTYYAIDTAVMDSMTPQLATYSPPTITPGVTTTSPTTKTATRMAQQLLASSSASDAKTKAANQNLGDLATANSAVKTSYLVQSKSISNAIADIPTCLGKK